MDEFLHNDRVTMTKHGFQQVPGPCRLQRRYKDVTIISKICCAVYTSGLRLLRKSVIWSLSHGDWKPKFSQCLRTTILILWTHLLPWATLLNVYTLDTFATLSKLFQYYKLASFCHPCKHVLKRKFDRGFASNENSDQIRNCQLHLHEWANLEEM